MRDYAVSSVVFGGGAERGISTRHWARLGALFIAFGFIALFAHASMDEGSWWLHGAWCVAGLGLGARTLVRSFRAGIQQVLQDHRIMFFGAFVAYFLFGALFLAVGAEEDVSRSLNYYYIDARDAMRVNAINSIGFGVALVSSAIVRGHWMERQATRVARAFSAVPVHVAVLAFLIAGGLAALHVLTLDLGLRDGIVSGAWRLFGRLSLVAILLGSAHAGRWKSGLGFLAVLVAMIEMSAGLLLFNKTSIILPAAMLVAGFALRTKSRKWLVLGTLALVVLFTSIAGPIAYSRNVYGTEGGGVVAARLVVLEEAFLTDRSNETTEEYNPWARFNYTAPQAAAMHFYDAGSGGSDVELIPWLFVPRAIAPGKPIITRSGTEMHRMITGRSGSSTGVGVFASAYYNGGWAALAIISFVCGFILAQTSAVSRAILASRALILLPFVLLGLHIAFRIDGHFVADYIGAFIYILYPLLLATLLLALRPRRNSRGQ